MSKAYKDEDIFARDGFKCIYCGFDGSSFKSWAYLEVDHFKPRSKNGPDADDNLVTSCIICNRMKASQLFNDKEAAKVELQRYWKQMRKFWEDNVLPKVNNTDFQI